MSDCNISTKDLYYHLFLYLKDGKVPFSQILTHLKCNKPDTDYKEFVQRAKGMYENEFGADSIDLISSDLAAYAVNKLYGKKTIEKSDLVDDFSNAFYNIDDAKEISEFIIKVMNIVKTKYKLTLSSDELEIIEDNLENEYPDDRFLALGIKIYKSYLQNKGYELPTKHMTKGEWHSYIKRALSGKTRSRSRSPSPARSPRPSVKEEKPSKNRILDFDTCKSREFTKDKLLEYITLKGWKISKNKNKSQLCQFIQDQTNKEKGRKEEDEEEEQDKKEDKKKKQKKKAREVEELELDQEEKEEKITPCGDYKNYNNEDEFYACDENEFCDANKKVCMDEDEVVDEEYRKITLKKDDKKYVFLGKKETLLGINKKYKSILSESSEEEKERKREEEEERQREEEKERKREEEERQREEEKERKREDKRQREDEEIVIGEDLSLSDLLKRFKIAPSVVAKKLDKIKEQMEKEEEEKEKEEEEKEEEEEEIEIEIEEEEQEPEIVLPEYEEEPDRDIAIDFQELQKTLRNILKEPSEKNLLKKDLISIPRKISYCVGLRV